MHSWIQASLSSLLQDVPGEENVIVVAKYKKRKQIEKTSNSML